MTIGPGLAPVFVNAPNPTADELALIERFMRSGAGFEGPLCDWCEEHGWRASEIAANPDGTVSVVLRRVTDRPDRPWEIALPLMLISKTETKLC